LFAIQQLSIFAINPAKQIWMEVFKFGGASVCTVERIQNVANILKSYSHEKIVVVVSAMGKTTNALEKVVEAFYSGNKEEALKLFNAIKENHKEISNQLTTKPINQLTDFFTEVEWLLHDKPAKSFDYYYDQIVCAGELLSSFILSKYLNDNNINNTWVDVRDVLRTDNNFRDAKIDWTVTSEKIQSIILPLLSENNMVLTQGFIGATDENESTTLGREGSDYSAAVFANLLNAKNQTIWKDVPGVMNADPKEYNEAMLISELNYKEVIEMAYYGAQVIHPKTIKPLQNKNIPLYVKSFLQPAALGTIIHNQTLSKLPPIIVYKQKQVLVQFSSKDFSFIGEGLTARVYEIFESLKFKPNLTQNAAISLLCVVDDHASKVEQLALTSSEFFDVQLIKNLTMLTIRHYNNNLLEELIGDKKVVLQQQTPETVQVLLTSPNNSEGSVSMQHKS
jgi:aspartate kinase